MSPFTGVLVITQKWIKLYVYISVFGDHLHDSPHVAPQRERMARLCFVKLSIMSVEFILRFLLTEKKK